jgi:hemolysin activation/secretion protein
MILRKKFLVVGLCLGVLAISARTHAAEISPAPTAAAPAPAPGRPLRKIVITESVDVANTFVPPPDSGFVVLSPGLSSFDLAELTKRLASGENLIIQERLAAAVAQVIENFLRQNNYPTATAIVPTQSIAEGILRLIVQLGPTAATVAEQAKTASWKIRKINVHGARWFSESLLREKLRIEQGGMIKYADLDQAISWTNNNPFRRVRVKLDPVPNTGEADLTIAVQEALPLRLALTHDTAGNEILGKNRFIGSVSYANLWGRDHQVSYQYITSDKPDVFQAHGFDYRVPLPWRHYVQLSASYFHAQPELLGGLFLQDGETITSDLRYTMPLRAGENPIDVYAALSFKESNNNLTWDPHFSNIVLPGTKTDIFQFTIGASAVRRDKRGAWGFGANLTMSPGRVNSRNSEIAFQDSRWGAEPRYAYGSLSIQRLLNLKNGWDLSSRAVLQIADGNLLATEQLSIGGGSSVRGFRENVFAGDQGFVFTTDLLTPVWKRQVPYFSKRRGPLETRFLVFYDAANSEAKQRFDTDPKRKPLASTGVGVRMSLATNFSLAADYGWQLSHLPYEVEEHSRGHVKVTFAY